MGLYVSASICSLEASTWPTSFFKGFKDFARKFIGALLYLGKLFHEWQFLQSQKRKRKHPLVSDFSAAECVQIASSFKFDCLVLKICMFGMRKQTQLSIRGLHPIQLAGTYLYTDIGAPSMFYHSSHNIVIMQESQLVQKLRREALRGGMGKLWPKAQKIHLHR